MKTRLFVVVLIVVGVVVFFFNRRRSNISTCQLQTCHGLDITCGPNPKGGCTAMFAFGDNCLQYATCGFVNGKCQPIDNPQFSKCRDCLELCTKEFPEDVEKAFECGAGCQ